MALVFGSGFRADPANPAWGLGCVCLGTGLAFAPPFLAGFVVRVFGVGFCLRPVNPWWGVRVCACMRVLCPYLAIVGWGVWCVCSGTGVPRLMWLGCLVQVLVSAFTPPILAGVLGCVCLCALFACTLPVLAGVCGVGVCACFRVSAAPRNSWLGCWGVCVCVRAPPVPRQSWLGFVVRVCGFWFPLSPC